MTLSAATENLHNILPFLKCPTCAFSQLHASAVLLCRCFSVLFRPSFLWQPFLHFLLCPWPDANMQVHNIFLDAVHSFSPVHTLLVCHCVTLDFLESNKQKPPLSSWIQSRLSNKTQLSNRWEYKSQWVNFITEYRLFYNSGQLWFTNNSLWC